MKKHQSAKYRKAKKEEHSKLKAKKEQSRRAKRQQHLERDRQATVYVDTAEPEEVKQMLRDAGINIEETQATEPQSESISPARRAFQDV